MIYNTSLYLPTEVFRSPFRTRMVSSSCLSTSISRFFICALIWGFVRVNFIHFIYTHIIMLGGVIYDLIIIGAINLKITISVVPLLIFLPNWIKLFSLTSVWKSLFINWINFVNSLNLIMILLRLNFRRWIGILY